MLFSQVIGQQHLKDTLRQMFTTNKVPHALLFLGSPGSGSLPLSLAYARYLFCENRLPQDSCGACSSCRKMEKFSHPDLHFTFPTIGANALSDHFLDGWRKMLTENPYREANQWLELIQGEGKQGNINKEECLQIIRKLSLKSFEGGPKVLLLWYPEFLGKEGNRLLKMIEEPPADTYFVLVAENADLILPTILSRCQTIKVGRLLDEEIIHTLQEKHMVPLSQAQSIAMLVGGSMVEAQKILTNADGNQSTLFLDWMRKCYKGNGMEMADWVDGFADLNKESQKYFLLYSLQFVRETLAAGTLNDPGHTRWGQSGQDIANMAKILDINKIGALAGLFNETYSSLERNANVKLLFLRASLQINKILKQGSN